MIHTVGVSDAPNLSCVLPVVTHAAFIAHTRNTGQCQPVGCVLWEL
jgi:hypothetical protein